MGFTTVNELLHGVAWSFLFKQKTLFLLCKKTPRNSVVKQKISLLKLQKNISQFISSLYLLLNHEF